METMKVSKEDKKLLKELKASLDKEGIKLGGLGKVAGYAARKVLLK